jgi:hypothetical protein
MFFLWRRMDEDDRRRVWRLYGWFSGLMACGSCFGAVTWAARMMNMVDIYRGFDSVSSIDVAQRYYLIGTGRRWRAVYVVAYAIEFFCLITAKLMVLDRMSDFAAPQGDGARKRWAAGGRIVMAFVVLGNAAGLASAIAAAVYFQKSGDAAVSASHYAIANNSQAATELASSSQMELTRGLYISSYQAFSEVTVLLLIVAAFVLVGVFCARRASSYLLQVSAELLGANGAAASATADAVRAVRLQMVITTFVVFLAFVLRSAVSTLLALSNYLNEYYKECPGVERGSFCNACYNMYTHVSPQLASVAVFCTTHCSARAPGTAMERIHARVSANRCSHRLTCHSARCAVEHDVQAHSATYESQPHRGTVSHGFIGASHPVGRAVGLSAVNMCSSRWWRGRGRGRGRRCSSSAQRAVGCVCRRILQAIFSTHLLCCFITSLCLFLGVPLAPTTPRVSL